MNTATSLAGLPYNEDGTGLRRPPPGAAGLSAVRALPSGAMRQYSAVEFDRGWPGVDHFIRTLKAIGAIRPSSAEPGYAILDVLDVTGDIIGDYSVPHARAFTYIKRKLHLTVEGEDSDA